MSRSSARRSSTDSAARRGRMGTDSSGQRGQTEPLAALAAVLVLGFALALYADALSAVEPTHPETGPADATLQSVHDAVSEDGAARPRRVQAATAAGPQGYDVNVTLGAADRRWTAGPSPPPSATDAGRRTPVRVDRWTIRPGRLRVVIWS